MTELRIFPVTSNPTHHFFIAHAEIEWTARDEQDRVLVFTDRQKAIEKLETYRNSRNLFVVGMGDEKWELFRKEVRHVLVT